MKKKILFTVALAICISMSVSAQKARKRVISRTAKSVQVKAAIPKPIDLGLSVKWSDINLGGNATSSGTLMEIDKGSEMTDSLGEGWRLPTNEEWKELIDNCKIDIITDKGLASKLIFTSHINGASISIIVPKIARKNFNAENRNIVNDGKREYKITLILLASDDDKYIFFTIFENESLRQSTRDILTSNGISTDLRQWSDDCRKQLDERLRNDNGIIGINSLFDWIAIKDYVDSIDGDMINIRPVFESSDDE